MQQTHCSPQISRPKLHCFPEDQANQSVASPSYLRRGALASPDLGSERQAQVPVLVLGVIVTGRYVLRLQKRLPELQHNRLVGDGAWQRPRVPIHHLWRDARVVSLPIQILKDSILVQKPNFTTIIECVFALDIDAWFSQYQSLHLVRRAVPISTMDAK